MSGLGLGGGRADLLATQLAADWLTGNLGSAAEQQLAAQVGARGRGRVVCVGGCKDGGRGLKIPARGGRNRTELAKYRGA